MTSVENQERRVASLVQATNRLPDWFPSSESSSMADLLKIYVFHLSPIWPPNMGQT